MVVSLSSHDDFERFQDLAYDAFRVIETRQVSPFLSIFKTESTDYVLSQSWIRQIEGIVGPVKANAKAKELVSRLKGIVSTTNYYLSIYQEEHNIHTLLEGCRFPKNAIQFKVIFWPYIKEIAILLFLSSMNMEKRLMTKTACESASTISRNSPAASI
jgi:hypothetical protein